MISEILHLKEIENKLNSFSVGSLLKISFELSKTKKIKTKKNLIHTILLNPPGLIRQSVKNLLESYYKKTENNLQLDTVYYVQTPVLKAFVEVKEKDKTGDMFTVRLLNISSHRGFKIGDLVKIDSRYIYTLEDKFLNKRIYFHENKPPYQYQNGNLNRIITENINHSYRKGYSVEILKENLQKVVVSIINIFLT